MYVIEIYSLKTKSWTPCYTTNNRDDAAKRFWRLYNDGYNPRIRKETP